MASVIRSGSVVRVFSGLARYWMPRVPPYHAHVLPPHPHTTTLHTSLIRALATQRPIKDVQDSQVALIDIEKALMRMDADVRRTGRTTMRDIERILKQIKTLNHATSRHSQMLLRCCGDMLPDEKPDVRHRLVQHIWHTLQELQVQLDISHYNTLLQVYLENDHKFSPTQILSELEERGIQPNRVTHQRLIARYCQDGDIEGAIRILEFMKKEELPVGENIFHTLIMGHARSKDLENAYGMLEVMRSSGLEPTTDTYATLLTSYAEAGDMAAIEATLEECKAADLTLLDRDLMEVIFALASGGHVTGAMQMMERLHKGDGYNQDAINLIYRLLNIDRHQMAYLMFQSMVMPRKAAPLGDFFIKQLVRCGTDVATIVHYCHEMKKEGTNATALVTALGTALSEGHAETALALMPIMREHGHDIRPHYFWPIVMHYAKLNDAHSIYKTVEEMIRLQVPLTMDTFQGYIVPGVLGCGAGEEQLMAGLGQAGVSSLAFMTSALVGHHLSNKDLVAAAGVVKRYHLTRVKTILRPDLATAYVRSGNAADAVTILGQMPLTLEQAGSEDKEAQEEEEQDGQHEGGEGRVLLGGRGQDHAGLFLKDVLFRCRRFNVYGRLEPLMQEMARKGLGVSKGMAESIRSALREAEATETVLELLDTLASGDLTFQRLSSQPGEPVSLHQAIVNLELTIAALEKQDKPTTRLQLNLLSALARNGDIDKAEELMKKMDAENSEYGAGLYALLVDMYAKAGHLEKATDTLARLEKHPDARLDPAKFFCLAGLMVQHHQMDEAVKLIETHGCAYANVPADSRMVRQQASAVLEPLADKGDVAAVRRLTDAVIASGVVTPSGYIFRPLIKAYMANDDLDGALAEFERLSLEHRITPLKQDLTLKCIELEDGSRLQKIMDLSINVHGEMGSLYDMVFCFLDANRITQAKKLLNTPGLRGHNDKLNRQCIQYVAQNKTTNLENLVAATKNIWDVDRTMMYTHLFNAYEKQGDCDKALEILTSMQEENVAPSEELLCKIGAFLKQHGREVPFVIPDLPPPTPSGQTQATPPPKPSGQTQATPPPKPGSPNQVPLTRQFRQAVRNKDFQLAQSLLKKIEDEGGHLSIHERSNLIGNMVQADQVSHAAQLTLHMLAGKVHPRVPVLRFLVVNMARLGDVDGLLAFNKYLDESLKRRISFNNRLADSYCVVGRWQEVLDDLRTQLSNTHDADLPTLETQIPHGSIIRMLKETSSAYQPVCDLSEEFAARGMVSVANCLWMYNFYEGQHTQAEQIYKKHLASSSKLMFRAVLREAKERGDPALVHKLLTCIESHPAITTPETALIYNCWMDVLSDKQEFSKGLEVLRSALTTLTLDDLGNATLVKLKAGVEASGNTFDYAIPPKTVKKRKVESSSSSSSSSDSDEKA